jgi:polyhydroxyalkanoate synthesis repressor PhaR
MKSKKVVIKKYENRRLYDATNSRYINLDEVAEMVREGAEVQAVDATTGEDITRLVLTQIIVEGAKGRDSTLPLDILRQMVIATGKASQESFLKYMRAMFEMYQNAYRGFSPAMTPLNFMHMMMTPGVGPAGGGGSPSPPGPPAAEDAPARARPATTHVSELHRRIDELERLIPTAPQKKRKRPRDRR